MTMRGQLPTFGGFPLPSLAQPSAGPSLYGGVRNKRDGWRLASGREITSQYITRLWQASVPAPAFSKG